MSRRFALLSVTALGLLAGCAQKPRTVAAVAPPVIMVPVPAPTMPKGASPTIVIPVALAAPNRDLVLTYLYTRSGGTQVTDARIQLRLLDGTSRIEFFRPSDGSSMGDPVIHDAPGLRRQAAVARQNA